MNGLHLTGFRDSVYTRSVRLALAEKGLDYVFEDVNPFDAASADQLRVQHPFGRVPVLRHGTFALYETAAILDYLDAVFGDVPLTPDDPQTRARMRQVLGIVDAYAYWPLVRQVYAHGYYRPAVGEEADVETLALGLAEAGRVLDALETIAVEGLVLNGRDITQADCHLMAMLDAFACVSEGKAMLTDRPTLARWYAEVSTRETVLESRPKVMKGS